MSNLSPFSLAKWFRNSLIETLLICSNQQIITGSFMNYTYSISSVLFSSAVQQPPRKYLQHSFLGRLLLSKISSGEALKSGQVCPPHIDVPNCWLFSKPLQQPTLAEDIMQHWSRRLPLVSNSSLICSGGQQKLPQLMFWPPRHSIQKIIACPSVQEVSLSTIINPKICM